jgi:hypothetical protein
MLCAIPPAMLTEITESKFVFFNKYIIVKLSIPPAKEYAIAITFPNINPEIRTLAIDRTYASLVPKLYKAKTITIFASPNFIPGMPTENGINTST